jgi:hypothetical protein
MVAIPRAGVRERPERRLSSEPPPGPGRGTIAGIAATSLIAVASKASAVPGATEDPSRKICPDVSSG